MVSLLKSSSLLRRFFVARFQSELGTGAAYVALVLVAYQRLHSGWAVALVLLADFVPGIVLSAPFGALADRLPRRRLAIGADLLRAAAFIALALIGSFAATVILALLAGVGTALFRPAVNAALPGMVDDEQRTRATALHSALGSIGITVGPAVTALLLLFSSPTLVLAVNGATFLISAVLLSGVPLGGGASPASESDSTGAVKESVWSSTVEGVRAAAQIPGVMTMLAIGAVSILAGALMNVAEPLLATGPLHAGSAGYSLLVAIYGAGMVAGSLANARVGSDIATLRRRLLLGNALSGVGMIASANAPSLPWAIGSFALTGVSNGLMMGPEVRLVQELVAERLLGRVFGLRDMLGNIAFVLAFVSAGVILEIIGVRAVFALGGGALLILTAGAYAGFRPERAASVTRVAQVTPARIGHAHGPKPTSATAPTGT